MSDPLTLIRSLAAEHGFEIVGVTSAAPLAEARARLQDWCDAGHQASLGYMDRDPPQRADPRTLHKTVRSVISVAVNHYVPQPPFEAEARFGRVARYAWGRDYHDVVLPRLEALANALREPLGAGKVRAACDYSPFLERAAAARGGIGFFGKHTCLLLPRKGSWYFLGEILLDVELPTTEGGGDDHCGTCRDCLVACPTDAFPAAFTLDARRCISYLTIEHAGSIPRELRSRMGPWVFGCDVCQDVCPFNRFATPAPWPEFDPAEGVGMRLDLAELLALRTDAAFEERFAGTPLLRPGRVGLVRNASIAAANVGAVDAMPALRTCLTDSHASVREHALWAIAVLDPEDGRACAEGLRGTDPDAAVRAEAEAVLAGGGA